MCWGCLKLLWHDFQLVKVCWTGCVLARGGYSKYEVNSFYMLNNSLLLIRGFFFWISPLIHTQQIRIVFHCSQHPTELYKLSLSCFFCLESPLCKCSHFKSRLSFQFKWFFLYEGLPDFQARTYPTLSSVLSMWLVPLIRSLHWPCPIFVWGSVSFARAATTDQVT